MRAFCYFQLTLHFGDVPYGYENTSVTDYSLTSRFDIYDSLIDGLKKAEPLMYSIGQGNINQERMSRTFCDALIGQIALFAGGYQTIRTDVSGLYGSVTFTSKKAPRPINAYTPAVPITLPIIKQQKLTYKKLLITKALLV
jgi:hypothetical protein